MTGGGSGYYPDSKITGPTGNYLAVNADGSINTQTTAVTAGTSTNAPKYTGITSASSARTATGNTGAIALTGTPKYVTVTVNITAVSGTTPTIAWQFLATDANGTLVHCLPVTGGLTAVASTQYRLTFGPDCPLTAPAAATATNFVGVGSAPTTFNPGANIQLGWVIGGTTPSITFQYGIQQLY